MAIPRRQRPGAVTMSGWLVYLAALLNAIQGIALIIAAARPNRIGGTVAYYSDGYLDLQRDPRSAVRRDPGLAGAAPA